MKRESNIFVCMFIVFSSEGSIHQYYESRRHLLNDMQPSRRVKAQETKQRSRHNANQRKVNIGYCFEAAIGLVVPLVVRQKEKVSQGS